MKSVEYIPVSAFGTVITGKTPSTSNDDFWDGDIPFITPSDIIDYNVKFLNNTERTISKKGVEKQKNTLLPKDAVCVTCIGSTIGKICYTSEYSITNQQINSIIVNDDFNSHYIYYVFKYCKDFIVLYGSGTGSGVPIISKNKFLKLKLPVITDLKSQIKISNILNQYDSLIINNSKRIQLLEQILEKVYKHLINKIPIN